MASSGNSRSRPSSWYGSSSIYGGLPSSGYSSSLDLYRSPSYSLSFPSNSRSAYSRYRRYYEPRYSTSSRPQYDSSFWWQKNYPPLQAESDDEEDDDQVPGAGKAIKRVDLNKLLNRREHRTDTYGNPSLIVRRGQAFSIDVYMNVPYNADTDTIKVQLTTGDKPVQSKGTLLRVEAGKDSNEEMVSIRWSARVDRVDNDGQLVTLSVMPAADCIVGEYNLFVELYKPDENGDVQMKRHKASESLFILFNAWCEDDQVWLQNEDERQEYVLNERGRVYVGNANLGERSIHGRPWNFGQMSKSVMRCALYLLNKSYLSTQAHCNPTLVVRCLSAMANSCDNDGVLEGNWSGKYNGGTSPSDWNGSVAIIEEYMLTKRPVKFGQCWVFSGVLVTLCRALGIPTRSVTNFESAHDHDYSMTIDSHVDLNGRPLKHMDDSVWNFHVWNESWCRRPDLPPGNDGWQAFDSTPQEASEGVMRCGPAPVAAIKKGDVIVGYDSKFIFAEVNGDRITWSVKSLTGDMVPTSYNFQSIGKFISTKSVTSNDRLDITHDYKFAEGTDEEREAVKKAAQHSSRNDKLAAFYAMEQSSDVDFNYEGSCEQNGDITIHVSATNNSEEPRSVKVNMYGMAKYYTGVPGQELAEQHLNLDLDAGEFKDVQWLVGASTYLPQLDEDATLGLYLMAEVKETGQIYTNTDTFWVDIPDLDVQTSKTRPAVGEEFDVTISFTNNLSVKMTSCNLYIEGAGIQKHKKVILDKSYLLPGETLEKTVTLSAKYPGNREVIANFHSQQIVGITGAVELQVKE